MQISKTKNHKTINLMAETALNEFNIRNLHELGIGPRPIPGEIKTNFQTSRPDRGNRIMKFFSMGWAILAKKKIYTDMTHG